MRFLTIPDLRRIKFVGGTPIDIGVPPDTGVKLALPFGENTISKNERALGENVIFDISVSALKAGI